SVTAIGKYAFRDIPNLNIRGKNNTAAKAYARKNNIPFFEESVIRIEGGVLMAYSGMASHFTVPDTVTDINSFAFSGCDKLKSITIPGSVKRLPDSLFEGNKTLQTVTLCNGVTEIGSRAFYECSGLQSISIPGSVTKIGSQAFSYCHCLQELIIPDAVTEIGSEAFWGCSSLPAFHVDADNLRYTAEDGVLYNKSKTALLRYPPGRQEEKFIIPAGVTEITSCAFQGCRYLKHVTVPAGVKELSHTFAWCESLESAVLCRGVTSIGTDAFSYCTNLKSVRIPNSVEEIGTCAFNGCIGLENIQIPKSVKSIGEEAFYACHLKTVTIPGSVRHIGKKAFGYWRAFWEYKRDLTICGSPGSAAADYARYNDFRFISVIERYML
ncbi:MAG: leucine-rich repeat protein, partial [Lachnospiraceae bacterium]|nr:leucine-rich repeat protein [Lachnospiraceae bacterium]